jgi:hypothetical protein
MSNTSQELFETHEPNTSHSQFETQVKITIKMNYVKTPMFALTYNVMYVLLVATALPLARLADWLIRGRK